MVPVIYLISIKGREYFKCTVQPHLTTENQLIIMLTPYESLKLPIIVIVF